METKPESEAARSLKHKEELSQYCVLVQKLTGRCAKDCFDANDGKAGQEQFS